MLLLAGAVLLVRVTLPKGKESPRLDKDMEYPPKMPLDVVVVDAELVVLDEVEAGDSASSAGGRSNTTGDPRDEEFEWMEPPSES